MGGRENNFCCCGIIKLGLMMRGVPWLRWDFSSRVFLMVVYGSLCFFLIIGIAARNFLDVESGFYLTL